MSDDLKKTTPLTEGSMKKGGLNEKPATSQRPEPPKPQPPSNTSSKSHN